MLPPNTAEYQRTRRNPNKEPTWKNAPDDPWGPAQPIPEPPKDAKKTGYVAPRSVDTMAIPQFLQRQRNSPDQQPQAGKQLSHKVVDQVFTALAPLLLSSGAATVSPLRDR